METNGIIITIWYYYVRTYYKISLRLLVETK